MLVFLFTDIESSTRLWEEHTAAMTGVIARHDQILRAVVGDHGGRITKHTGDGITAVFQTDGQPLACALQAQVRFSAEPWDQIGHLPIRVGLHAGEADFHPSAGTPDGDYFGPPVNATARVMSAAWGGQILFTPEVTAAWPLPEGATLLDLGRHLLKNVSAPQQLYQLLHPQLPRSEFPPPRTLSGQSIRTAVDEGGSQLAALEPERMGLALLSATLLPALQGELDPEAGALEGNLGVLEDLGATSLRGFVAAFAAQLRTGEPLPTSELQTMLHGELRARWQAGGETAIVLRADASRLLQAVHGVEAAMSAASGDVKEALARGLAGLGEQFGEFRWMLAGVQDTLAEMRTRQALQMAAQLEQLELQQEQLDLQRQQLAKTDQLLERDRPVLAWEPVVEARPPSFLEEGAQDVAEAPVFVARRRELARLDGFLAEALAGQGRVVFVAGGPGRGKTALVSEFARHSMQAHPDLLVASGNCNAFSGSGDPYLPVREAMAMLSGDVEDRWLAGAVSTDQAQRLWAAIPAATQALLRRGPNALGVLVDGPALLARATRATGGVGTPWLDPLRQAVDRAATPAGLEQSHLFEQATNVLRLVSESHPLLLILDDLQWADSASIDLLFHLGRRLAGSRILLAGTYRPEEVAVERQDARHPLAKVLRELTRQFGDIQIDLCEEGEAEGRGFVDALLETQPNQLGGDFRQALFQHTGGHPLFTVELLRAMQERGDLVQDDQGRWVEGPALDWQALPTRVEAVIEERIGRLSDDLRELLSVASVEGEEFTAQVLARVQDQRERQLLRSLSQELVKRHRLVRERGEVQVGLRLLSRYRFSHALFQHYLYHDLSPGERRLLHGEIAQVLEELFSSRTNRIAVQLAFHYGRAGAPDRALPYLIEAGHRARAAYANQEAIGYYTEALQILGEHEPQRLDLLAARAAVCALVARYDEAKADALEMLTRSTDSCDEVRRVDALLALAEVHLATEHLEAEALAQEALATARELGDRVREGRALSYLGALSWFAGDYPRSRDMFEATIPIFTQVNMPGEASRSLHWLSLALGNLDEFGPSLEAAERSVVLSREAGDRQQEATGLRRIAIAYHIQHQQDDALHYAEQALLLHQELGDRAEESAALNVLGLVHAYLGDDEQTERCLRGSLELAESIGSSVNIRHAVVNLMVYHYEHRGEYENSLEFLARHVETAHLREDEWLVARLQVWQGASLYDLGQYAAAQEILETSFDSTARIGSLAEQSFCLIQLGTSQALAGDYEAAKENLATAAQMAREAQDDYHYRFALMRQGLCALLEGEPETMEWGLERIQLQLEGLADYHGMIKIAGYWIMAGLKLALDRADEALAHASDGLRLMKTFPFPRWPEQIYFTHSSILRALGRDAEAGEYLQKAYERVMLVARKTTDPELKRSWLENVSVNRQIVEGWAARSGTNQA